MRFDLRRERSYEASGQFVRGVLSIQWKICSKVDEPTRINGIVASGCSPSQQDQRSSALKGVVCRHSIFGDSGGPWGTPNFYAAQIGRTHTRHRANSKRHSWILLACKAQLPTRDDHEHLSMKLLADFGLRRMCVKDGANMVRSRPWNTRRQRDAPFVTGPSLRETQDLPRHAPSHARRDSLGF